MAEPDLIYKMTVLKLLTMAGMPLSNTQITDFFQDNNYTGFFTSQEIIHSMEEQKLITGEKSHNLTLFSPTSEGRKTLNLLSDRITPAIERDIRNYLARNGIEIKTRNNVLSSYDRATGGGYTVHLSLKNNENEIMDMNVHVSSREEAESFCYNWKVRYEEVYASLLDILVQ